jgi:hypothetical protein
MRSPLQAHGLDPPCIVLPAQAGVQQAFAAAVGRLHRNHQARAVFPDLPAGLVAVDLRALQQAVPTRSPRIASAASRLAPFPQIGGVPACRRVR